MNQIFAVKLTITEVTDDKIKVLGNACLIYGYWDNIEMCITPYRVHILSKCSMWTIDVYLFDILGDVSQISFDIIQQYNILLPRNRKRNNFNAQHFVFYKHSEHRLVVNKSRNLDTVCLSLVDLALGYMGTFTDVWPSQLTPSIRMLSA